MIDFTSVQTFPIPPEMLKLQNQITELINENKLIKKILFALAIGGTAFLGYKIFKYFNNDEPESKYGRSDQKSNQVR